MNKLSPDGVPWEQSGAAPHCDQRVLHKPGECTACDLYPNWQRARQIQCIAFTGQEPKDGEVFCPSELQRTVETIHRWPGNQPSKD